MKEKQKWLQGLLDRLTFRSAIGAGAALLLLVTALAGHFECRITLAAAENTMNTLKQQCISYNRLIAADRTKSLFRLSDLMRDFSDRLAYRAELASDEYLEQYVDNLRLSGIALLDGELRLEASGYTRRFRDVNWMHSPDGSRFADIIRYPFKVYVDRLLVSGEYYDICAVARKDAPGILVGFYHQPTGLVTSTEADLESLLAGLHLEKDGSYLIAEGGRVRVSSNESAASGAAGETEIAQALSQIDKDGSLHLFYANGRYYWGCRSGCENYSLYLYYPITGMLSAWLAAAGVFAAAYCLFLFALAALRNRELRKRRKALEESNRKLTQSVEMLRALETIYFTLFYVDLERDEYKTVYIAPWLENAIPASGRYTELKQMFMPMIVPSFREEIDLKMSIAYIQDTLSMDKITDVRKSFYTDYQSIRDSEVKWCRVSATPVDYSADGRPHHILALLQDVDDEKSRETNYQAQILQEAEDAKIANRAKTAFLRRISHDIRTPINGILGYIDMSKRHPDDAEIQARCRDNMAIAMNALLDLVNRVLDMSKIESGEILLEDKPFDLEDILEQVNAIIAPQAAEKQVRYEMECKESLPVTHLIGSSLHLSQILLNIANNAVKYSNPGGCVQVSTKMIGRTDDEASYEFVCADDGIGMSETFQRHMYEPFMQEQSNARTTYEGVGLGLSIVKKLVDVMGGTITCESKKDVGTTFRIRLPFRIDKTFQPCEPTQKTEDGKLLAGKNVLLVEDNALNMEIAGTLLTERGANVTQAWNGREAVEKFSESPVGFYDLIFMDIMMPTMNGLEATKAIRALDRPDAQRVPISAMSANAFQDDIQSSLNAGMNAHIAKPVDDKKFMSAAYDLLV